MASLFVNEYRRSNLGDLFPLANQIVTFTAATTGASTGALSNANTDVITLQSDSGCMVLIGSSTTVTLPTTVSGIRIGAGLPPLPIAVKPLSRIVAIST